MARDLRIGLVCLTYLYNEERVAWARRSFESLLRTETPGYQPVMLMVIRLGFAGLRGVLPEGYFPQFRTLMNLQPPDAKDACAAATWGFDCLFRNHEEVTHGFFLADDFIYHPKWMIELEGVINRHPQAKSWSVYRSGNTRWHRTLDVQGDDHLVSSISGPGAFSRSEWEEWGVDYHSFPWQGGWTLDVLHPELRPGERWVTGRSYIQQIGVRGMHNRAGECDESLDFVGEATEVMQP